MLPMILMVTQKLVDIRCFDSISALQKYFKKNISTQINLSISRVLISNFNSKTSHAGMYHKMLKYIFVSNKYQCQSQRIIQLARLYCSLFLTVSIVYWTQHVKFQKAIIMISMTKIICMYWIVKSDDIWPWHFKSIETSTVETFWIQFSQLPAIYFVINFLTGQYFRMSKSRLQILTILSFCHKIPEGNWNVRWSCCPEWYLRVKKNQ